MNWTPWVLMSLGLVGAWQLLWPQRSIRWRLWRPRSPLVVTNGEHDVIRTSDAEEFEAIIDTDAVPKITIISGPKGCGKTRLCKEVVAKRVKEKAGYLCYFNLERGFKQFPEALNAYPKMCWLLRKPENEQWCIQETFDRLYTQAQGHTTLLIVDGLNEAYDINKKSFRTFMTCVKQLTDEELIRVVFITSQGDALSEIQAYFDARIRKLYIAGDMNDEEITNYLKTWGREEDKEAIVEACGTRINLVASACEMWEDIEKRKEETPKEKIIGCLFETSRKTKIVKAFKGKSREAIIPYLESKGFSLFFAIYLFHKLCFVFVFFRFDIIEGTDKAYAILDYLGDLDYFKDNLKKEGIWESGIVNILVEHDILIRKKGLEGFEYESKVMGNFFKSEQFVKELTELI